VKRPSLPKMNRRSKNALKCCIPILILIILLAYGFLHFRQLVSETPITTYQFYDLIIKVIAALLTLSAVVVALFKEFLISGFNYVELKIEKRDSDFIYEAINPITQPPIAESYKTYLKVSNNGNILAEGCVIKVSEIKYKNDRTGIEKVIEVFDSVHLKWTNEQEEIGIHPKNHTSVSVIILSNENSTVPGRGQGQNAKLSIGGISIPKEFTNGRYEVIFELLCKNHRGIKYNLKIAWDGTWKSRSSDIKAHYSIAEG